MEKNGQTTQRVNLIAIDVDSDDDDDNDDTIVVFFVIIIT